MSPTLRRLTGAVVIATGLAGTSTHCYPKTS
jgi:hypothetical protein